MQNQPEVMGFYDVVFHCMCNKDFMREYNRLNESTLFQDTRKPIERMIDEATGYAETLNTKHDEEMHAFVGFVWEYIWIPLIFDKKSKEDVNAG